MSACREWSGEERRCRLGLYGGRPSPGVCAVCDRYEGPPRGLGDVVHSVARAATAGLVQPCAGCRQRRRRWNREGSRPRAT
jgi:hypothetical protein